MPVKVSKVSIDVTKLVTAMSTSRAVKRGIHERYFVPRVEKLAVEAEDLYFSALVQLANLLRRGFPGATNIGSKNRKVKFANRPSTSVSISFNTATGQDSFTVNWKLHAYQFSKYKESLQLGVGRFWRMRGDLHNQIDNLSYRATVTADVREKRDGALVSKGKGVKIRYSAKLRFSSLGSTLDELFRTPFITGNARDANVQSLGGFGDFDKLAWLESRRPFVAQMSARLGTAMSDKLFKI